MGNLNLLANVNFLMFVVNISIYSITKNSVSLSIGILNLIAALILLRSIK